MLREVGYVQCTEEGMHAVLLLPWEDILVRNLYNYRCWQNLLIVKNRIICFLKLMSPSPLREAAQIFPLPWEHLHVGHLHKYCCSQDLSSLEKGMCFMAKTCFNYSHSNIDSVTSVPLGKILVRNLYNRMYYVDLLILQGVLFLMGNFATLLKVAVSWHPWVHMHVRKLYNYRFFHDLPILQTGL